jgi:hypothetical protein
MPAYQASAALVIRHMLAAGELPTTTQCFHCGNDAQDTLVATVECEKAWVSGPGGLSWAFAVLVMGVWAVALGGRDGKELGRNLILHVPLKLCPPCRRTLRLRSPGRALGLASLACALAGVGALVLLGSAWGWLSLGLSALLWLTAVSTTARRRAVLKQLLLREPLYDRLLREYPGAGLHLDTE